MKTSPPQETELKLRLPGLRAEKAVLQALQQHGYKINDLRIIRNADLYLDSYSWLLLKKKWALRYRLANGQAQYTLKSIGGVIDGLAQRDEIEVALKRPLNDPRNIPAKTIRDKVMSLIFPQKPTALLKVDTVRREYQVATPDGAGLSLAFDCSAFSRAGKPTSVSNKKYYEMEAELKEGPVEALRRLQQDITGAAEYSAAAESKFEYGLKLLKLAPFSRKTPAELTVRLDDTLAVALHKIISAEFRWFQAQLEGLIEDYDPEFVHQARVTTRRMRSAIKVFKGAIDEDTGAYFSAELKLAAGMLGATRDIDVFKINLNVYQKQLDYFPDRVKQRLEKEIDAVRLTPFKTLLNYLKSTRYKKFERRIESYIGRLADCLEQPEGEVTLGRFAPEIITRDWQAVIKQGAAVLANPAMQKFHLLRIETKKLRYAAEFMAPAYQGALAPFIQRTGEIQDCLGELQDTVFTREFSRRLMQENQGSGDRSPVSFVLGEIYQYQAETAGERRATFKDIWERFTATETLNILQQAFSQPA